MVLIRSPHTFLGGLSQEWLSDLQEFLHVGLPKLIFIGLVSWFLILAVNFVTQRILKAAEHRTAIGIRAGQVKTLASVIRATGITIVLVLALLQVMENVLHFDLGPLLASAGVAGIALGLAAQTIVKDVLNGILILIEDQYTVGDVVTLAGMSGVVDTMTLRKTTLRGFDGTLYVIPNSQITSVANQSRDLISSTINISVDFSANPDEVIPVLQKVVDEVRNDPQYRDVFVEGPRVLGVDSIKGSEVIYPITVKTPARQQFDALREIQRRIRLALEAHDMLPGSPYRLPNHPGQSAPTIGASAQAPAAPPPDPTAAKPNETNPFSG
jgi:moderate conductance mechanosensitive channel